MEKKENALCFVCTHKCCCLRSNVIQTQISLSQMSFKNEILRLYQSSLGWSSMPSANSRDLWGESYDVGWVQLVRSTFINDLCSNGEASWLPECAEWPGSACPDGAGILPDDNGSMRHHFHAWIGHNRVQTITPPLTFAEEPFMQPSDRTHDQYTAMEKNEGQSEGK